MNIVKSGSLLVAIALSGAAVAGENVAQANIAAIYQPVAVAAVEGEAPAGGVSLLDGKVQEWLDPSKSIDVAVEAAADEAVARSGDVAQENIRGIYTAYSAN